MPWADATDTRLHPTLDLACGKANAHITQKKNVATSQSLRGPASGPLRQPRGAMTLTSNPTMPARLRRLVPVTIVPVALSAMILTAPAAEALTEQQIKDECKAANNGTYTTGFNQNGDRISSCCYKDIKGKQYCDMYTNGNYDGTFGRSGSEPGTPTATVQPGQPPPGTAPAARAAR